MMLVGAKSLTAVCVFLLFGASIASAQLTQVVGGTSCDGQPAGLCAIAAYGMATQGGEMYVADVNGHRVYMVDSGGIAHLFAGNGVAAYSGDSGPPLAASLWAPHDVATIGSAVFVSDARNNRIRRIEGGIITTVLSSGLNFPTGMSAAPGGTLLIANEGAHRVIRYDPVSGTQTVVAGSGVSGDFDGGGNPLLARLAFPSDVVEDAAGYVYIADKNTNKIRQVSPGGVFSTLAGTGLPKSTGDNGPCGLAAVNAPQSLAIDGLRLYISERDGTRVRMIQLDTGIISTFIGPGTSSTQLNRAKGPSALMISGPWIYLSDQLAEDVRKAPLSTETPTLTPALPTATETRTRSPTMTASHTPTHSPSSTPTPTPTPTETWTPTWTPSSTATDTPQPPVDTPTRVFTATGTYTPTTTATPPVQGRALYFTAARPIPGTVVTLDCGTAFTTMTDAAGRYDFGALSGDGCALSAARAVSPQDSAAITSLDASWAMQMAVDKRTPTEWEQIACDATSNGTISSLDAARILACSVGKAGPFGWVFIADGYDFTGVLRGDCTGSLVP